MKCQKCHEREANTHYTQIINGQKQEYYLCDQCAAESPEIQKMQMNFVNPFDMSLEHFLSGIFGNTMPGKSLGGTVTCPHCGMTFRDFTEGGKIGCSDCYEAFRDNLRAPLKQIHGSVEHNGKVPSRLGAGRRSERKIKKLEAELGQAVMEQNFERAAELRDQIKELKGE